MKLCYTRLLPLAIVAACEEAQIPLGSSPIGLALDSIPPLGFGTWNLKEKNTSEAVSWAIQVGYRHIDAAAAYGNEEQVGDGIADGLLKTGLRREDIWVTSKLWNDKHDINDIDSALDSTLRKLRVGYLDLYHMHWPVTDELTGQHSINYLDTWSAMALQIANGKVRHLGVCNFSPAQLSDLLNHTLLVPSVHQMEHHPYLSQSSWLAWHRKRGIHITSYSPLGGTNPTYDDSRGPGQLLNNTIVKAIAEERGCTPAQVVLKWGLERGDSVIPKSIHKDRIEENFGSTKCGLKEEDLKEIDGLGEERNRYNNPSGSWGVRLFEGLEDAEGKHEEASFASVVS